MRGRHVHHALHPREMARRSTMDGGFQIVHNRQYIVDMISGASRPDAAWRPCERQGASYRAHANGAA